MLLSLSTVALVLQPFTAELPWAPKGKQSLISCSNTNAEISKGGVEIKTLCCQGCHVVCIILWRCCFCVVVRDPLWSEDTLLWFIGLGFIDWSMHRPSGKPRCSRPGGGEITKWQGVTWTCSPLFPWLHQDQSSQLNWRWILLRVCFITAGQIGQSVLDRKPF